MLFLKGAVQCAVKSTNFICYCLFGVLVLFGAHETLCDDCQECNEN